MNVCAAMGQKIGMSCQNYCAGVQCIRNYSFFFFSEPDCCRKTTLQMTKNEVCCNEHCKYQSRCRVTMLRKPLLGCAHLPERGKKGPKWAQSSYALIIKQARLLVAAGILVFASSSTTKTVNRNKFG